MKMNIFMIFAFVTAGFALPARAGDNGLPLLPSKAEIVDKARQANQPREERVSMSIWKLNDGDFQLDDSFLGIHMSGRQESEERLTIGGWLDDGYFRGEVRPDFGGRDLVFDSWDVDLDISEFGGDYTIDGSIHKPEGFPEYVYLTMYERFSDDGSFYISDSGINLNIDDRWIDGWMDMNKYTEKFLVALGAIVVKIQQKYEEQEKVQENSKK